MNPFATQQHHARSMMYLIQARASPDYLLSSSNYNSFNLSFSGGGRRQHFSFNSGKTPAASYKGVPPHLIAGGTLVVLLRPTATPTNGIIRSVNRAYL